MSRGATMGPLRVVRVEATSGVMCIGAAALLVAVVLAFLTKQDDHKWSDRTTLAAL